MLFVCLFIMFDLGFVCFFGLFGIFCWVFKYFLLLTFFGFCCLFVVVVVCCILLLPF